MRKIRPKASLISLPVPLPIPKPPSVYRLKKSLLRISVKAFRFFWPDVPKQPECLKFWGVLYFGEGGSGKTLHQASEIERVFKYWHWLYKKNPRLKRGIVFTNQVLKDSALKGNEEFYYHWDNAEDLRFCPRKYCWRGEEKHFLHGAVVVMDDISTILPPDNWQITPTWMRKQWTQSGHFGIHFLFNCQDPFAYDINARRQTRICYRFDKIFGNRRPDETAKPVKRIWGIYVRRRIKAKWLWQFGDLEPEQIAEFKEALRAQKEMSGSHRVPFRGIWKSTVHFITRHKCEIYDTLQDVQQYEPAGYIGVKEYDCIDESHNHTDPDAPNYTKFKKSDHELI